VPNGGRGLEILHHLGLVDDGHFRKIVPTVPVGGQAGEAVEAATI